MSNNSIMNILSFNSTSIQKLAFKIRENNKLSDVTFQHVSDIINNVKLRGDSAVIEYAEKFDGVNLTNDSIRITTDSIKFAYDAADPVQIEALSVAKDRITKIQSNIMDSISSISLTYDGCSVSYKPKPVDSVGCYIPGGQAAYPSSLLMSVLPAKIANVPRIFICTPSTKSNNVDPLLLAACYMCEISEVYQIGGAQAISAMAFGTQSILPASKIIGAGGSYVTAAKMIISSDVSIDLPAGPTELLILADDTADPSSIAFDLVSQAEHGEDSLCGLISTSSSIIDSVQDALPNALDSTPRIKLAKNSLSNNGFILKVNDYSDAISFINHFAPEHLQICTSDPNQIEKQITSAGLILLGNNTPTSATDYLVGTNHILPTMGNASTYSGLSVLNFLKLTGIVECDLSWIQSNFSLIKSLADSEGLVGHSNSIKYRVDNSVE